MKRTIVITYLRQQNFRIMKYKSNMLQKCYEVFNYNIFLSFKALLGIYKKQAINKNFIEGFYLVAFYFSDKNYFLRHSLRFLGRKKVNLQNL